MKDRLKYEYLVANKEIELLLIKQSQLLFNLDKNNNRQKVKELLKDCATHLQVMLDNIDTMPELG